jgi:hypothetical protein
VGYDTRMEHFTKQQLILLMLLVSFVTSIVTGITTVSLMAQDPQGVTQTINRVVERTIEKVSDANNGASVAALTKEVTVVVKEEEFVTKAVQEAHDGIIRIKNKKDGALLGLGVIINYDGTIIADRTATISFREYTGVYQGVAYDIVPDKQDKKTGISTFKFKDGVPPTINPIRVATTDAVAGQSIVAVSGADRDVVSIGIISSLVYESQASSVLSSIDTTVSQNALLSGTPLMGLDGTLIALKIGKDALGQDILMPIARIMAALGALANAQ